MQQTFGQLCVHLNRNQRQPREFSCAKSFEEKGKRQKSSVIFSEIIPTLQNLYDNLYDINLHIYRAERELTVVDIRYYPKSSLDQDYRQKVVHNPPMLHCMVASPPWLSDKKEKFDINWEHKQWLINWNLFWVRRKLKYQKRLS